jgi:hypothetical protein
MTRIAYMKILLEKQKQKEPTQKNLRQRTGFS